MINYKEVNGVIEDINKGEQATASETGYPSP